MDERPFIYPKQEFLATLRRAGYSPDVVAELDRELGPEVDVRRNAELLARHGIDRNELTSRMGASP